jgi:hypothetical protein
LEHQPTFAWWVGTTLRRRDWIIASATNKRYRQRTHKFGIELPKTVKEALEIDRRTGTNCRREALDLEIKNVRVAFDVLDDKDEIPVGYQHVRGQLIFEIKMGSLRWKARCVADGHLTDPPASKTYASVVSGESVRIAFTIAALNDLDVQAAHMLNAYLTSSCDEKVWTIWLRIRTRIKRKTGNKSSFALWTEEFRGSILISSCIIYGTFGIHEL